jgi:hypothetical protein
MRPQVALSVSRASVASALARAERDPGPSAKSAQRNSRPLGPGSALARKQGAARIDRGARLAGTREGAAQQSLVSRASAASALARAERDPGPSARSAQRYIILTDVPSWRPWVPARRSRASKVRHALTGRSRAQRSGTRPGTQRKKVGDERPVWPASPKSRGADDFYAAINLVGLPHLSFGFRSPRQGT